MSWICISKMVASRHCFPWHAQGWLSRATGKTRSSTSSNREKSATPEEARSKCGASSAAASKRRKLSAALSAYTEVHSEAVNETWPNMAVCCRGREGLGLRNMTTPDQKSRAIDTWQRSERLPLPRRNEQRDHISSRSQDQPARGKLLECLLQVKREHIESQCRKESKKASTGTSYSLCFRNVIQAWHLLSMTGTVLEMLGQFMSCNVGQRFRRVSGEHNS